MPTRQKPLVPSDGLTGPAALRSRGATPGMIRLRHMLRPMARTRIGWALRDALRRLWRRRGARGPYTEAELLARTEDFNLKAEGYWQSLSAEDPGRRDILNKPLSTVRDTPQILYQLGLTIEALDLGVGHTVLDFGAGSCWLSSMLNRLRCRTIAVDVSPTALALGQELFRLDPRHRLDLEPRFVSYDGRRLSLPDASVDRVVCFDAFHHIPNQDEVLAELYRVLRPGGRAVMTEPGEGHAHAGQSRFESERAGVLENELCLEDLVTKMRAAGFDRILMKPYPGPAAYTLTAEEYQRLIEGANHLYPLSVLREQLRRTYIMILVKGEERRDSRNPGRLLADIRLLDKEGPRGRAGTRVPLRLFIKNIGDTMWLHAADPAGGTVALGGRLLDAAGACVAEAFVAAGLPGDVAPGRMVVVETDVMLPPKVGRYRARLDLVAASVCWFEQCDSRPAEFDVFVDAIPHSREPHLLRADIELPAGPPAGPLAPGEPVLLPIRVTNVGDTIWLDGSAGAVGAVGVGGHLLDESGTVTIPDYFRSSLPRAVAPGESLGLEASFLAPLQAGRHRLVLDLVAEQVGWFEATGSQPLELLLETTPGVPNSTSPGLLRARLELEGAGEAVQTQPGATITLRLRITNSGNTLWLGEPRPAGGHVALGGHLWDANGTALEWDLFRTRLPTNVPPGETAQMTCRFTAPSEKGRYAVELDLVDEGITWFGNRGSPTAVLPLVVG